LTGYPLRPEQSLVAFVPHYFTGASCGLHQDAEADMCNDWIVSVSLGATVDFCYGARKDTLETVQLHNLSVLGMSRWLWHSVPTINGERWNMTFRCWKTLPSDARFRKPLPLAPLSQSEIQKKAMLQALEESAKE